MMTTLAVRLLAEEVHNPLWFPSSVFFPIIALVVFIGLGVVTWSFKDVAHRHAGKTDHSGGHADGHGH